MEYTKEQINSEIKGALSYPDIPSAEAAKYIKLNTATMDMYLTTKFNKAQLAIFKAILKKVSDSTAADNIFRDNHEVADKTLDQVASEIGNIEVKFTQEGIENFSQHKFKSSSEFYKALDSLRNDVLRVTSKGDTHEHCYGLFTGKIVAPKDMYDEYTVTVTSHVILKMLGFGRDNFFYIPAGVDEIDSLDSRSYRLFMELAWACHGRNEQSTDRNIDTVKGIAGVYGIKKFDEFKELNRAVISKAVKLFKEMKWLDVEITPLTSRGTPAVGRGKRASKISFNIKKMERFKEFDQMVSMNREKYRAEWM